MGQPLPWVTPDSEINDDMWATPDQSTDWVIDFYRCTWVHATETFAVTNLGELAFGHLEAHAVEGTYSPIVEGLDQVVNLDDGPTGCPDGLSRPGAGIVGEGEDTAMICVVRRPKGFHPSKLHLLEPVSSHSSRMPSKYESSSGRNPQK